MGCLAVHPLAHVAPVDHGRRVAAPGLATQRRPLPRNGRRGVRSSGAGGKRIKFELATLPRKKSERDMGREVKNTVGYPLMHNVL